MRPALTEKTRFSRSPHFLITLIEILKLSSIHLCHANLKHLEVYSLLRNATSFGFRKQRHAFKVQKCSTVISDAIFANFFKRYRESFSLAYPPNIFNVRGG